jgi:hypothetical protein
VRPLPRDDRSTNGGALMKRGTFRPVYATAIRLLCAHRWRHSHDARELVAALYNVPPTQVWQAAPLCSSCADCNLMHGIAS